MNYILLCEGFHNWLESSRLSVQSKFLFLHLVHLFNKLGWSEWVQVDNQRLMLELGVGREQTFIEVRDRLIDKGLIIYEKGKKGNPSKYKLNKEFPFISVANSVVKNVVQTVGNSVVNPVVQTVDINKLKQKLKQKESKSNKLDLPKKAAFGNFLHVHLTEQEHSRLIAEYGEVTPEIIQFLDDWIEMKGSYKAKSHYLAIKKWVVTAFNEQKLKEKSQKLKEQELENRMNKQQNGGNNYGQNWSNNSKYEYGKTQHNGEPWCTEYPE